MKVNPTETKSVHCKIYVEPSIDKEIKGFQLREGLASYSEAGRKLMLLGLESLGV